jgi:dUTP pyrophosphatase
LIRVEVQKLREDAIIPAYQSEEAAGFDLHAIEDAHIPAGERMLIKTGLAVALPKGYELQVRPRSGLAFKHGITVLNSPGTVDSDYRGELMVLLMNHGKEGFEIQKGERIAQAVLKAVIQADFKPVEELSETARGASGFGSTGR